MRRNLTLFVASIVAILMLAGAGAGFASPSPAVTVSVSAVSDISITDYVVAVDVTASDNTFILATDNQHKLTTENIIIEPGTGNVGATIDNLYVENKDGTLVLVVDDAVFTIDENYTVTKDDLETKGLDLTMDNIRIKFESGDNICTIRLTLAGTDVPYPSNRLSVSESYTTEPEVKYESDESWFTVKDRVTVSNPSAHFAAENVDVSVTYPGFAVSQGPSTFTCFLAAGASAHCDLNYQKAGPYVNTIHEPVAVADNKWKTDMKVYSHENLDDIVDFEFDPAVSPWVDYFPDFDFDTLTVTVNGASVTPKSASVLLEDFSLVAGPNTIAFTWTPVVPPPYVPPVVVPWWLVEFAGVPTWMWIVVCVFVVVILISLRPEIVRRKST